MFRDEIKTTFHEFPGPKLVAQIAADVAKGKQRHARNAHDEVAFKKRVTKPSRKDSVKASALSERNNREAFSLLPSAPLYPVAERREQTVRKRHRVRKKSKKTSKKIASDKAKAARLAKVKDVRTIRKWEAVEREATKQAIRDRVAAHEAFVAAKEAEPPKKVTFVQTAEQVRDMVDEVLSLADPALYLDAEGISLSRDGTLVLLQMYIDTPAGPHTYVIDVWTLKTDGTFLTPGDIHPNTNFKSILENPSVPKLFWDCRMDSEALHA